MPNPRPRVLHAAALLRPSAGMLQQMRWEHEAAEALALPWTVRMYCPPGSTAPSEVVEFGSRPAGGGPGGAAGALLRWAALRRDYHRWLARRALDHDVLLLRYYVHDPYQWRFARARTRPLHFVSHTRAVRELALPGGPVARARSALESWVGDRALARADGVVGVTGELAREEAARAGRAGLARHVYPNGVVYDDGADAPPDRREGEVPELLFVAHFLPWHGLAELLDSMRGDAAPCVLHLVGELPAPLLARARAEPRARLHGALDRAGIEALAARSWLGLSSLAMHRLGMTEGSPLKVRQYLALGLAVYGNRDVLPEDFPHYRVGGPDLGGILAFAREARPVGRAEVARAARPFIDKRVLLERLYRHLVATLDDGPPAAG